MSLQNVLKYKNWSISIFSIFGQKFVNLNIVDAEFLKILKNNLKTGFTGAS